MKRNTPLSNQDGSAMVIALLTLVLLTMVGTLFLAQTKTETQISGFDMRSSQALFNAEAGYAEVLARMDAADSANYIGEPLGTITPGWGRYLVLAAGNGSRDPEYTYTETDTLDNDGDGIVDESGERFPEVLTRQAANPINYPWAKVEYMKNATGQVVLYGDHDGNLSTPHRLNLTKGAPVIIVTAEGGQGTARRVIEVQAVKRPFEMVQSSVYSESDDFQFNGTQFMVSGQDHDPVTGAPVPGAPEVPGIMTTGDPTAIQGDLAAMQQNNVEGDGGEPSVASAPVDLDLEALADEYRPYAEYVVPTGTYDSMEWGSYGDYTVVNCTGDLHISGSVEGGGLLIVDGDFRCSGSFTWYGVILVLGDMTWTGGGSDIHIYGATLVQGGTDDQTVSGNADLYYSSAALNRLNFIAPYTVMNWREIN